MSADTTRILIMAGGTGGHVFPALAVADALRARGATVSWLGTRAGIEARVVPAAGLPIRFLSIRGLRGKGALGWALAPLRLSRALVQAVGVLWRERPHAVLGMGGFVTGPGGVAARLLRRPLLIHEQNAVAGLTNRLLAPFASRVLEAFPGTFPAARHALHTGNPVRGPITALPAPQVRFTGRQGPLRLLVIGGSLGAEALNRTLPEALGQLDTAQRPQVWHQSGERLFEAARGYYRAAGVEARVVPFIEDMAAAYAWADLVLCRAGALTVTELANAGVAALLVPYPHAVDDHQTHNAESLVRAGAAQLLPQTRFDAVALREHLHAFAGAQGRERLLEMAGAARALARPQAAEEVAKLCLEVAHG